MRPRAEQRKTPGVHPTVWEPSTFGLKNPKVARSWNAQAGKTIINVTNPTRRQLRLTSSPHPARPRPGLRVPAWAERYRRRGDGCVDEDGRDGGGGGERLGVEDSAAGRGAIQQ